MYGATDGTRLAALRPTLEARGRLNQAVRAFFADHGFLEVDTPVRVAVPAMEAHIDAFACGDAWLRTSPELHMKRLVAAGYERIFQLATCFREGERGDRHHPEYTMLEWYHTDLTPLELEHQLRELMQAGTRAVTGGSPVLSHHGCSVNLAEPWERWTVQELFLEHAGWDPLAEFDADRFDEDLVGQVEPWIASRDRAVVLYGYPKELAALAEIDAEDSRVAQRWELYVAGVELCNAYGELTDAAEQRQRFTRWGQERASQGRPVYPLDEPFLTALQAGLPACSGAALGVDRWLMLATGATSFDEILPFREA